MRRLPVAFAVALSVVLLSPSLALAQDENPSKEQQELEKQAREANEKKQEAAEKRLEEQQKEAAEQKKKVQQQEEELEKLRPKRIPSPYVDPPDLAFGPYGSTALTMQSPRPRTRVYLAGDAFGWKSNPQGFPYRDTGWGTSGRVGGEVAFGRLAFGADLPWLFYNNVDNQANRLGLGDLSFFTKLHIFGAKEGGNYLSSMLRLTVPTHLPKEKVDDAAADLSGEGYPVAEGFYTKIEFAGLVGTTLLKRFSFGAQAGLVAIIGTGDYDSCPSGMVPSQAPAFECRAESHVGFDGHAHIGIRILEALDLHVMAGGVTASGKNFASGGYLAAGLNLNLASFRISLGAAIPLNTELQRYYSWLATLSLSWELHQYKLPNAK
jgi:hypothetical protein